MSNPHDKSLGQKHGANPRNGSSRLKNGIANPPGHPRARGVGDGDKDDNVVVVSRGNDMATEVTSWGSRGSAQRGGPRFWRQRREPDPPPEVMQAARVLRRRTNPKMPQFPRSCSVCSLKLYGWRELFAHMKTHPQKESRCDMREISPPPGSPVEQEARNRGSSGSVDGQELASTLLHVSLRADKDLGHRDAAFSTTGSRGKDVAVASQGAGGSSSAARASPPRRGLGFDFDLNKPPPEKENDDDDGGGGLDLDLEKLPPEAEERGGPE